eukprot:m.183661 g.183661  ORF g.183661 m.183661 type:complete len:1148 (+) comp39310_c0_seq7:51-3494(+)
MSRTEGFSLPRIPATHSTLAIPSKTWTANPRSRSVHSRSLSEPAYYTSYLCCPRQDVPEYVLQDSSSFDETFAKVGMVLPRLQAQPKVDMPLTSLEYDSLHDPHVRHLYVNNSNLRRNLVSRGLVTQELKVVGSDREFREHVRAHEQFERREILHKQLDEKERHRLAKMEMAKSKIRFPKLIRESLKKEEERKRLREERLAKLTMKHHKEEEERRRDVLTGRALKREARLRRLHTAKMQEEQKRELLREYEEEQFNTKYNSRFEELPNGLEIAAWHREAEVLEHRMQVMKYLYWSKGKKSEEKRTIDFLFGTKKEETDLNVKEKVEEGIELEVMKVEEDRISVVQKLEELEKELEAVQEDQLKDEKEEEDEEEKEEVDRQQEIPVTDPQDELLQKVLLDAFTRADSDQDGHLSAEEFTATLNTYLDLMDEEIQTFLLGVTDDGKIDYSVLLPQLREMLVTAFQSRPEEYKAGVSSWLPLFSSTDGYIYFSRESGEVTRETPAELAPVIRDDLFVNTMMDIFMSGDLNGDGYIDRDEFYQLLQSPNVGLAYFSVEQAEDLLAAFDSNGDLRLTFEEFLPLARSMIRMIYQNSDQSLYPWVELESPKLGPFWYNKFTSEVQMYPPGPVQESAEEKQMGEVAKLESTVRSPLPPIQEAPSDKGSVADELAVQTSSPQPSLDIERPNTPLPVPVTPEVNNRPMEEKPSDEPRSPERSRRRRRRKRTESRDHEERRRRHRIRRGSRRERTEEELAEGTKIETPAEGERSEKTDENVDQRPAKEEKSESAAAGRPDAETESNSKEKPSAEEKLYTEEEPEPSVEGREKQMTQAVPPNLHGKSTEEESSELPPASREADPGKANAVSSENNEVFNDDQPDPKPGMQQSADTTPLEVAKAHTLEAEKSELSSPSKETETDEVMADSNHDNARVGDEGQPEERRGLKDNEGMPSTEEVPPEVAKKSTETKESEGTEEPVKGSADRIPERDVKLMNDENADSEELLGDKDKEEKEEEIPLDVTKESDTEPEHKPPQETKTSKVALPAITETNNKTPEVSESERSSDLVQSDTDELIKSEKNLADDEKISLGLASSSSLPKPSRPSSGRPPRPASRTSVTSMTSRAKAVAASPIEEQPITDQEKMESRRNSLAEQQSN